MKKLLLLGLFAATTSVFADPGGIPVPDAGSTALLLLIAGSAGMAVKHFQKRK